MSDDFPAALQAVPTFVRRHDSRNALVAFRNYFSLTKPEVNVLILITTAAGCYLAFLAGAASFSIPRLFSAVAATLLLASGAGALNQVIERRYDAQMKRTMRRPIAAGRISPARAFVFGAILATCGAVWLFLVVNATAGFLGIFALFVYLFGYTPLKRKTPHCTAVGAVAGAIPPLIGWFACGGKFDAEAVLLYALLFFWQFPHVMSIAAMYRSDYERAGYRIVPRDGKNARFLVISTVLPCAALLVLLAAPAFAQSTVLLLAASVLGGAFLLYGIRFAVRRSAAVARQLLTASIVYVPLALVLLIAIEKHRVPAH